MHKNSFAAAVLLAGLFAGCAGEDGKPGPRGAEGEQGSSCTVETAGGVARIVCTDGTTTTLDPGACTVTTDGGTHTITCPGGTTVITDGEPLARGTILGDVKLFGLPATAGIEATLVELDRTVVTDETGAFAFDGVAPGLYRIRLTYPGYEPIDLPNVAIFGGEIHVGTHVLKLGRRMGDGNTDFAVTDDGRKAALLVDGWASGIGDLVIVDLETGEEMLVAEEAGWPEFIGNRWVVARDHMGAGDDLLIHDLQDGTTQRIADASRFYQMHESVLYVRDGEVFLLRLPGSEPFRVEGATDVWNYTDDGRFALMQAGSAYFTFDTTTGTRSEPFSPAQAYFSWASGKVAFLAPVDSVPRLHVVDPVTGETELSPFTETITRMKWGPRGEALMVWNSASGWVLTADGPVPLTGSGLFVDANLDPNERFVGYLQGGEYRLRELATSTEWTMPGGVTFNEEGSWALGSNDTTIRAVSLATGAATDYTATVDWIFFAGESFLRVQAPDSADTCIDLTTGFQVDVGDATWFVVRGDVVHLTRNAADGELELVDCTDGSVTTTGLVAEVWDGTPSRSHTLVRDAGGIFHVIASADLTALPIDEKVFDTHFFRDDSFWYTAGELATGPAGPFGVASEHRRTLSLYRVVLP